MSDALRQRAIRLLARREHSRAELLNKLAPHGTPAEIESVLNELASKGLQSDARCAENYLRSRAARLGAARQRQALRARGIDAALIASQLESVELPDELELTRAVWSRKFAAPPADAREWARQARFLQGRGFSAETIRKLLNKHK